MKFSLRRRRSAFTLIEIMIVVAIIALLAAIMTGNAVRARKRAQATHVLTDLRMLDTAMGQWAAENNKKVGDVADFSDLLPYVKMRGSVSSGRDLFNQAYGPFSVDFTPKVADFTFNSLSDVAPADFWSPFK